MIPVKIGIMGFGTVGSGAFRILGGNAGNIGEKAGARLEVGRVLVRDRDKARRTPVPSGLLTSDPSDILDDPATGIVVEVMGGIHPAKEYILKALEAGKSVVTANKELVADHGPELREAAARRSVDFLFEAAVAGGLPIIRPLQHCLAANRILEIMGIINGTTNLMLSKMGRDGSDYREALREAQEKGYAEADPSADVDGYDAARKLAILASIAFNARVTFADVFVEGINRIAKEDIAYARDLDAQIKLLGIAKDTPEGIEVRVHPCFIRRSHPLASVEDVFNAVFVVGDAVGETMFYGRGAGDLPTGSAVVADIIEAAQNRLRGDFRAPSVRCESRPLKNMVDVRTGYYIRLKATDRPGVLASIAGALGDHDVSIASALQTTTDGRIAEIVLVTHTVREGNVQDALEAMRNLSTVNQICNLIRVEG